jgi:hypothetical protein
MAVELIDQQRNVVERWQFLFADTVANNTYGIMLIGARKYRGAVVGGEWINGDDLPDYVRKFLCVEKKHKVGGWYAPDWKSVKELGTFGVNARLHKIRPGCGTFSIERTITTTRIVSDKEYDLMYEAAEEEFYTENDPEEFEFQGLFGYIRHIDD